MGGVTSSLLDEEIFRSPFHPPKEVLFIIKYPCKYDLKTGILRGYTVFDPLYDPYFFLREKRST